MKNIYLAALLMTLSLFWTGCADDRGGASLDNSSTIASPGDPNLGHPAHNSPNAGNS